jgi:hypothetical protein
MCPSLSSRRAAAVLAGSLLGLVVVPSVAAEARADGAGEVGVARVSVSEIDNAARSHLERAEAFLANGQYAEAVDTVRRVMDAGGDALIAIDDAALAGAEGRSIPWLLRDADLGAHWQTLQSLLTKAADRRSWLAYPDTDVPLADIRARLITASILSGDSPRARQELELLRRLSPDAIGQIGGKTGKYVELMDRSKST